MTEESALIVPNEEYLKAGIHIGTKFRTKYMDNFIYKTRSDGLSVLNIQTIDERLRLAAKMLATYAPEDIMVSCRRETGHKPVSMFGKITGATVFAGRYPPGTMTNPNLKGYAEAKVMVVCDAWPDKNAVDDALQMGVPVIALCDTNNQSNNIDLVIPCNNKGKKSLALVFWVLSKLYMEYRGLANKGQAFGYTIEDFMEE
ncbi:MAG: 30S ribosomal protein S2 [archaeon]